MRALSLLLLLLTIAAASPLSLQFKAACTGPFVTQEKRQIGQNWTVAPVAGITGNPSPAPRQVKITLSQTIDPTKVRLFSETERGRIPLSIITATANSVTFVLGRCIPNDVVTIDLLAQ